MVRTPVERRPEHEVVLTCARARLQPHHPDRLRRLVNTEMDWNVVERTAIRHGVATLVYHHLSGSGVIDSNDKRIARLEERFFVSAGNNLMLTREFLGLLATLRDAGVAAIPYKGPALGASLYGNGALREFTDLDILVRPADALKAKDAIVDLGYVPEVPLTPARERALMHGRTEYFLRFDRAVRAGQITLELHWRLPASFPLDMDAFWQRLQPVTILDQAWPHFSPADLLIVLSAHGFKHGWDTLKWIADVAELIDAHPHLDWKEVLGDATRMGGLRIVLLGCAVAHGVREAALPERVRALIESDAVVSSRAQLVTAHLMDGLPQRFGVIDNLRIRERLQDRVNYAADLLARLVVPTVVESAAESGWYSGPIGYVSRPIRRVGRFARRFAAGVR